VQKLLGNKIMELKLRQRIIGAVVLVALAIIFIPLLFKNSDTPAANAKPMTLTAQIPPAPAKPTPAPQTIVMIKNKDLSAPDAANTSNINSTNTISSSRAPIIQVGTALPTPTPAAAISNTSATTQQSAAATTPVMANAASTTVKATSASKTTTLNNPPAANTSTNKNINLVEDETLSPPGADKYIGTTITNKNTAKSKKGVAPAITKTAQVNTKTTKPVKNHEHEKAITEKHQLATNKKAILASAATTKKKVDMKNSDSKKHHAKETNSTIKSKNTLEAKSSKPGSIDTVKPLSTLAAAKSSTAKTPAGAAWEVRLGSFANANNVKDLVKQLRSHGFKAYTQSIQSSVGNLTRVAIGPETKREKADAIQARLTKELKIKSEVVPFTPIPDDK
jgi:DedD protein